VSAYLTIEAIEVTFRTIAACQQGSEIVFGYQVPDAFLDEAGREFSDAASKQVAKSGEPFTTHLSPNEVEALVGRCGLEVVEHPTPGDLYDCYFSERHDSLRPSTIGRLVAARVSN
jgi:O-methyltransferase involved in polyketide biosynthesis